MAVAPFPHLYEVAANMKESFPVEITGQELATLQIGPPPEFGGQKGYWSPETLFLASIVGCFLLTFRALAELSSQKWLELRCEVQGQVEKIEGRLAFRRIVLRAHLRVPTGQATAKTQRLLERAEEHCLIANSLRIPAELEAEITEAG